MRSLLFRNTPLDREGTLPPPGNWGGGKWLCPHCGDIWASVRLPQLDWLAVTYPCDTCGITRYRFHSCPGSLLTGIKFLTGDNNLERILNSASESFLFHEALVHARWIIARHGMP